VTKASRRRQQSGSPSSNAPSTDRPAETTGTPVSAPSSARAGRRERQRTAYKPSFMERYRTAIIVVATLTGVALLSVFVFTSAAQPSYACSTIWTPDPTAPPTAGATQALGYVQPDMGPGHIGPGDKVTYTHCAPASGKHANVDGQGPIAARVYGPDDSVIPQGWIHNLEHGGFVILYQGTSAGASPEGQAAFKAFWEAFPPAQDCGPVIARFDQMSSPFQALVWGRVLPLDTFDEAQVTAFWNQWGGVTNAEKFCPAPDRPSPSPSPSTESASPVPSDSPSVAPSPS
jgi:hypothetical protein